MLLVLPGAVPRERVCHAVCLLREWGSWCRAQRQHLIHGLAHHCSRVSRDALSCRLVSLAACTVLRLPSLM